MLITVKTNKKYINEPEEHIKINTKNILKTFEYKITINTHYHNFRPTELHVIKDGCDVLYKIFLEHNNLNNYPNFELYKFFDYFFADLNDGKYVYFFEKVEPKKQFIKHFICKVSNNIKHNIFKI